MRFQKTAINSKNKWKDQSGEETTSTLSLTNMNLKSFKFSYKTDRLSFIFIMRMRIIFSMTKQFNCTRCQKEKMNGFMI